MKSIFTFTLIAGVSLLFCASAYSETIKGRFDPTTESCRVFTFKNVRSGAKVFKNVCLNCHYQGNVEQSFSYYATHLYPRAKSPGVWTHVFFDTPPKCKLDGSWGELSQNDLLNLNDYLYKKAAGTWDEYDKYEFC